MQQPRLIGIMRRELEAQQLKLSPYCTQQIEGLISHGLTRMQLAKALNNPGLLMRSEQNLKSLIAYLGNYAKNIGSYPGLNDKDFDDAIRNSPPFWPYCMSG